MMDGAGGAGSFPGVWGVERSVCGRRWRLRSGDGEGQIIAERLGLPEIIGRLLAQRGIDLDHAPWFLAPRLRDQLPDPSHLLDMDVAAERLARAVREGETIAIYGDYDVDGATSAALLTRFFDAVGARSRIYVPDRLREGYGPNAPALRLLRAEGASVVVTVDCGTTAHQPLAEAAQCGLDVIVIDHHVAEPLLPVATALVNPNRLDEASPYGFLAAVGVAFLLVIALNRALRAAGWYAGLRGEPDLLEWLDLVALGTVCDVVPLTGLNRAFVAQGIKVAQQRRNCGLDALATIASVNEPIDAYHLGFVLGPRVNAGGRVGAADLGARLLSTDDPALAAELARRLDALNGERRDIEASHPSGSNRHGRSRAAIAGAELCGGRRLAPRRDRHCRRPAARTLRAAGLRRRGRGWHRPRLRPFGSRAAARSCGDCGPSGRAVGQWRRSRDGGGLYGCFG